MRDTTANSQILGRVRRHQLTLILLGSFILAIGIAMMMIPMTLLSSALVIVAIGLIASALLKAGQFVIGRNKRGYSIKAVIIITLQIILDLLLASILLRNTLFSLTTLAIIFGLIFLVDGFLQCIIALRAPSARSRLLFLLSGVITAVMAILIIIRSSEFKIEWVGIILGIKLASFGLVLLLIALRSRQMQDPIIYTEIDTTILHKKPAQIYACYFGTAFHLGIYIGGNEVVHYRDDGLVHKTSWEEFLRGREPQKWDYPDITPAPDKTVIKTALSQVGVTSKYSLLNNNCEHFAIYCKTGGKNRNSKYAQVPAAIENISEHPFIGMIVEVYIRFAEWISFHVGGTIGKKAGIKIREFSSLITAWLLTPTIKQQKK